MSWWLIVAGVAYTLTIVFACAALWPEGGAMSDIVDRLRKENSSPPYYGVPKIQADAADEIERLRAALTEIRDAGPMTVDDQRWRVALAALDGSS